MTKHIFIPYSPHRWNITSFSYGYLLSFLEMWLTVFYMSGTCWILLVTNWGQQKVDAPLNKVTVIVIFGADLFFAGPALTSVHGCDVWPPGSHSAGLTCLPSAGDGTIWYATSGQLMNHRRWRTVKGLKDETRDITTELWSPLARLIPSICGYM